MFPYVYNIVRLTVFTRLRAYAAYKQVKERTIPHDIEEIIITFFM